MVKETMTDSEFCEVMAINIEQARSMPDYWHGGRLAYPPVACYGLCALLNSAWECALISYDQCRLLRITLTELRPACAFASYFFPPAEWRPRVKLLRKMARNLRRRGL